MKRHFYYAMKNCQDAEDLQSRLLTVVTHYQVLWVHLCFVWVLFLFYCCCCLFFIFLGGVGGEPYFLNVSPVHYYSFLYLLIQ